MGKEDKNISSVTTKFNYKKVLVRRRHLDEDIKFCVNEFWEECEILALSH